MRSDFSQLAPVQSSRKKVRATSRLMIRDADNRYYCTISVPDFDHEELEELVIAALMRERQVRTSAGRSGGKRSEARG